MRRLVVTVVLLLLVVVAVDRVAWFLAEQEIAKRIEASGQVGGSPRVEIAGFPFLTQVMAGRYERISVTAQRVAVQDGLYVDAVSGEADGIHIAASDIARQAHVPVPVDRLRTQGYVSFASLDAAARTQLGGGLTVTMSRAASGKVAVRGEVQGPLGRGRISAEANATIIDGKLVLSLIPTSIDVPFGIDLNLGSLFGIDYPLPPMPFGLKPEKLTVEAQGIRFTAAATDTVIDPQTLAQLSRNARS